MLKTGFARVDITPSLGTPLSGHFVGRAAEDILDPHYVTAVTFDNEEKRAVILSVDNIGVPQWFMDKFRQAIADACKTDYEAIYIACTHTHYAPYTADKDEKVYDAEYVALLERKLCDAAKLSVLDLAPSEMSYARSHVEGVSFIRRYRMKDGSARTNPGYLNPDVVAPIGEPDKTVQTIFIKREGKPQIGIVNFQVHADVVGGAGVSADFPKFVRDTYEKLIDNSLCMYINGPEGDTNHVDISLEESKCRTGYDRARYMGRKIAMAAVSNYELREKIDGDKISYGQKNVPVKYNKGTPEEYPEALRIIKEYERLGDPRLIPGMKEPVAHTMGKARRVVELEKYEDYKELYLSAVTVGNVAFGGIPGEPFTEVGRIVKRKSEFILTIPSCCTNGYEGYYPMAADYDEAGYESASARFVKGTAEKLADELSSLINSLKCN